MKSFPKVKEVYPLSEFRLEVVFDNGDMRVYDCSALLERADFSALKNEAFFRQVRVDQGGYGISWNDELDLAESELWLNGQSEKLQAVAEEPGIYGRKND